MTAILTPTRFNYGCDPNHDGHGLVELHAGKQSFRDLTYLTSFTSLLRADAMLVCVCVCVVRVCVLCVCVCVCACFDSFVQGARLGCRNFMGFASSRHSRLLPECARFDATHSPGKDTA